MLICVDLLYWIALVNSLESQLSTTKCLRESKTFSMNRALTLVKSVTAELHIYTMLTAMLIVSVCYRLDQVNRDFLWSLVVKSPRCILLIRTRVVSVKLVVL